MPHRWLILISRTGFENRNIVLLFCCSILLLPKKIKIRLFMGHTDLLKKTAIKNSNCNFVKTNNLILLVLYTPKADKSHYFS